MPPPRYRADAERRTCYFTVIRLTLYYYVLARDRRCWRAVKRGEPGALGSPGEWWCLAGVTADSAARSSVRETRVERRVLY